MLLLIDAGNSRVKWALADMDALALEGGNPAQPDTPARWVAEGVLPLADAGRLGQAWAGMTLTRVLVSNVAGPGFAALLKEQVAAVAGPGAAPSIEWFSASAERAGVRNGYQDPTRLGADRFAALIGARACYGQGALLVVTCGTATTIDALTPANLFTGGMILPGLDLMAGALAQNTAQLPLTAIEDGPLPDALFGDDTESAITHGCLAAQCGAIEHAYAQFARQPQSGPVRCILGGGAAARIAAQLSIPFQVAGNLVLAGLYYVAMERPTPC